MTSPLDSTSSLQAKFLVGLIATVISGLGMVWMLFRIEAQNKKPSTTEKTQTTSGENNDLQLSSENDAQYEMHDDNSNATTNKKPRFRYIRWPTKVLLILTVAILILLNYLLLVYLPSGMVWLNFLAIFAVMATFLRTQIGTELFRRRRCDRLMVLVTLFLIVAASLSLATYARLALKEGNIYQGPARIVGYDETNYDNAKDEQTMRTDLEVAWGGSWACPETPGVYCQAFVNGALCETSTADADAEEGNNDDGGRFLEKYYQDMKNSTNTTDTSSNQNKTQAEENKYQDNGNDNNNDEDLEKENEELEEELEEEEKENEELEEENEELQNEVNEEEEVVDEEEEYVEEEISYYFYDDDYFGDDYWVYDWDSVWGDYACEDLFDTDLEGMEYDANAKPGEDEWPFVNIYGSCKTCKAYLVDYYSTQHFNSIKEYQKQSHYYAVASAVSFVITVALLLKQRWAPAKEHEVQLLNNDGGTLA